MKTTKLTVLMTAGAILLAMPQDFIDQSLITEARKNLSHLRANPDAEGADFRFSHSMAAVLDGFDDVDLSASDDDWREAYAAATYACTRYFDEVRIIVGRRMATTAKAARRAERAVAHQALIDRQKEEGATRREERRLAHIAHNDGLREAA